MCLFRVTALSSLFALEPEFSQRVLSGLLSLISMIYKGRNMGRQTPFLLALLLPLLSSWGWVRFVFRHLPRSPSEVDVGWTTAFFSSERNAGTSLGLGLQLRVKIEFSPLSVCSRRLMYEFLRDGLVLIEAAMLSSSRGLASFVRPGITGGARGRVLLWWSRSFVGSSSLYFCLLFSRPSFLSRFVLAVCWGAFSFLVSLL